MPDETIDQRQIVADFQRELAARTAERDEGLAREAAVAEVLQVINASPGDLAPVFDAMLEKAMHLCEAAFGTLFIYDGELMQAAAFRGASPEYAEYLNKGPFRPRSGALARLIAGEVVAHSLDAADEASYREGNPHRRALVDLGGGRTHLAVPLRTADRLLGAFAIYRREVRPFNDQQIGLLQSFAAQVVIAIENARLLTETREALEQQTATAEVLGIINSSPGNLAPVWEAMLEKATRLCDAASGILWTWDGTRFWAVAQHGLPYDLVAKVRDDPNWRPTASQEEIAAGQDLVRDDDLSKTRGAEGTVVRGGMRTGFLVALRKGDVLLGAIRIFRQEPRPFTGKQIELVKNFAAQAVIAMENARLLDELRQRNDEIAEMNRELEARVTAQLAQLERTGKLRRFLAPQLADLIVAHGDESILESHRREIVVVFCDIRGFTAFAERAEPEEVMALLRDYHAALGPIVMRYEGTLDHYGGDGVMVFFNDPLPTPEPAKRAIEMAVAMRQAAAKVIEVWRRNGHEIGFGIGISQGYATLGQIGFAERMDYTAIGTVTNLAARLCQEAKDGQILVSRRVASAVADMVNLDEIGEVSLKGLSQAVAVFNVV